jgi:hypothetical protein
LSIRFSHSQGLNQNPAPLPASFNTRIDPMVTSLQGLAVRMLGATSSQTRPPLCKKESGHHYCLKIDQKDN